MPGTRIAESGQLFVTLPGTKERHTKTPEPSVDRNAIRLGGPKCESDDEAQARGALSPAFQNTMTARLFLQRGPQTDPAQTLDITACTQEMVDKLAALDGGDLSEIKHLLFSQATACQAIFAEMGRRAAYNMGGNIGASEAYMRLALRAQNQSRATLETLAEIINPRPVYINPKQVNHSTGPQQVNNADGPQQVNNGSMAPLACGENQKAANELLGGE